MFVARLSYKSEQRAREEIRAVREQPRVRVGITVPSAPSSPQLLSHSGWDLPARSGPGGDSLRELLRVLPFFLRGLACLRLLQRGPSAMISGFIDQSVRCSSARPADRSHGQSRSSARHAQLHHNSIKV